MTQANPLLSSINSGEFSPRMEARVDFDRYPNAAKMCRNMLLLPQGGFTRRPGSRFINEVKDSADPTILLPFEFNIETAYQIEMGDGYIRVYKRQARIEVANTDGAITNGTFDTDITGWDDLSTGSAAIAHDATNDRLQLTGAADGFAWAEQDVTIGGGFTAVEHVLKFKAEGFGGARVLLRIGTTTGGAEVIDDLELGVGEHSIAFTPGATTFYVQFRQRNDPARPMWIDNVSLIDAAPFETVSPYTTADLAELRYFQAADVMFLLHPEHPIRRIERRGDSSWSIVEPFFEDGPYLEVNPGTDLDRAQLIANPFFENGLKDWTVFTDANATIEAEPGQNRAVIGASADGDDAQLRQQVSSPDVNSEHVVHFMVNGTVRDDAFPFFEIGSTVGGENFYNNDAVVPRWTSAAFTPTGSAVHVSVGINIDDISPLLVHAVLIYPPSAKLMRVSGTTGSVTLTAVGHTPFKSTDIGRLIRLEWPGYEPGYGVITAFTSSTVVTLLILRRMPYAAVCTEKWQFGAWCEEEGYPTKVGFFEGRLYAVANEQQPQTLWGSQSGDLQNMRPDSWVEGAKSVEDDDAVTVTLQSSRIDAVVWLAELRDLLVGTAGSQWVISSAGEVVTPLDVAAKPHSVTPAADVEAEQTSQVVLFLDRSKRELYEVGFSFDDQAYITTLMTILADHIFRSPGKQLEFQRTPYSILWCPRDDGRIATLAYNRQHDILGWAQQIIGGSFGDGDAVVEHVSVIPGADDASQVYNSGNRDEVWMIVKRTIDGNTVRYVEMFEGVFEGPLREDYDTEDDWMEAVLAAQPDAFYVDSGITYDGAATATITGLGHLEGETVKVLADGKVHSDRTVASGQITLGYTASKVQVGLAYKTRYESLKLAVGAQFGTAVNKVKAVVGIGAVVLDCGPFKATSVDYDRDSGRRAHDLQWITLRRDETQKQSDAVPLVSGELGVSTETHYPPDARLYIESDLPTPLTILAFAPEIKGTDARAT